MNKLLATVLRLAVVGTMLRRLVARADAHVVGGAGGERLAVRGKVARPVVAAGPGAAARQPAATEPRASVSTLAKRVMKRAGAAAITDGAAALTYYFVMAMVPSLLLCVMLAGLLIDDPDAAFRKITEFFEIDEAGGLGEAVDTLLTTVTANSGSGAAGTVFAFGTITALWAFGGAMSNLMKIINRVWGLEETRSAVHRRLLAVGMALATALVTALAVTAVALGGGVATRIVEEAGLGTLGSVALRIAPFVALLVGLALYLAVVYWIAPNKEVRIWKWISLGAVTATVVWLVATLGFVIYLGTFATYNEVYGPLAAGVIFLLWLWISSLSILLGACVDAEIERSTALGRDQRPVQGVVPDAR